MSEILLKRIGLDKTISTKQNLDPLIAVIGPQKQYPEKEFAHEDRGLTFPLEWDGESVFNQIPTGVLPLALPLTSLPAPNTLP